MEGENWEVFVNGNCLVVVIHNHHVQHSVKDYIVLESNVLNSWSKRLHAHFVFFLFFFCWFLEISFHRVGQILVQQWIRVYIPNHAGLLKEASSDKPSLWVVCGLLWAHSACWSCSQLWLLRVLFMAIAHVAVASDLITYRIQETSLIVLKVCTFTVTLPHTACHCQCMSLDYFAIVCALKVIIFEVPNLHHEIH